MSGTEQVGTAQRPVRVAVVGAGPAGFFLAEALLARESPQFCVDLFERLPTPFGLVRSGVAPDHQKMKSVTRVFEKTAQNQRFRFLGNVHVGRAVEAGELLQRYDQVVYAIGSSRDRRLGIPGEELAGCHAATAFVGWYNAHPDFADFPFDLKTPRAVVVGVGNVALDIARILLRSPAELAKTDIADHAMEALQTSQIREVVMLARRGPAQAAFFAGQLDEIERLASVSVCVEAKHLEDAGCSLEDLDANARRNLDLLRLLSQRPLTGSDRTLRLEFLSSPVEILGDADRRVRAVRVERTELVREAAGFAARGTGQFFELPAGLVFRSIGYLGEPVPGVPFDAKSGIIPNQEGRVIQGPGGPIVPRTYAVGWIRRGPTGVIGTNKADAALVAEKMVEDVPLLSRADGVEAPRAECPIEGLLEARGIRVASFADWLTIDSLEVALGHQHGKVREKFDSIEAMMNQLLRDSTPHEGV